MGRDQIIDTLRRHQAELKAMGVATLSLFGSVAREEQGPRSDVDLFFDYDDPDFSLVELVAVKRRIADILGTDADVMTRKSLRRRLRERIERNAIRVF
jgi:uncharacterized protein